LEIESKSNGDTVTVTCLQSVNVIAENGGMSLIEGETYEMAPDKAKELAGLGYVEIGGGSPLGAGAAAPRSGDEAGAEPFSPKVPRRPA
jgi:hypothetical protein